MHNVLYLVANGHPELLPIIKILCKNERLRCKFYELELEYNKLDKEVIKKYSKEPTFNVLNIIYRTKEFKCIPNLTRKLIIVDRNINSKIIKIRKLPNKLKELILGEGLYEQLEEGDLPNSLIKLSQ